MFSECFCFFGASLRGDLKRGFWKAVNRPSKDRRSCSRLKRQGPVLAPPGNPGRDEWPPVTERRELEMVATPEGTVVEKVDGIYSFFFFFFFFFFFLNIKHLCFFFFSLIVFSFLFPISV